MRTLENIIKEVLDDDKISVVITPKTSLRNDLGFDSFKLAQLTVEIEDDYEVDIFENGNVDTVNDIQTILDKKA